MKLTITPHHFEELIKKSYSLDIVYFLKLIEEQYDVSAMVKDSARIAALYQSLIRKGLITENGDKITTIGNDLLKFLETEQEVKLIKKKSSVDDFETWWKVYPGTDTFSHKGKKFAGSRSLRQNKEDCKIKFNKIIIEGDYTAKQLTDALIYDVNQKKESSFKQNVNKLTYMQNSLTYLNQRSFEPFIELINQGVEIDNTPQGGTDI
jgi:hypothetical protein